MNALSFCEIVSVAGGIHSLESKVALVITFGPFGILDNYVGKGKLIAGKAVHLGRSVNVFGIKSGFGIVCKAALCIRKNIG